MKPAFFNHKDFWAGVMFIGIGAAAIIGARNYPFGSALRMGPGYLPTFLGGILALIGFYVMVRGFFRSEKIDRNWSVRALILLPFSLGLFGIVMDTMGFIPALVVLIFGSAASGREFKVIEVLTIALLLVALSVAVFIWGLGLPFTLLKKF
jgi:hypothetical protein